MATITLELNDELVERLHQAGDRLPALLSQALDFGGIPGKALPASPASSAWLEAIDFLAKSPSPQEIIDFKLSSESQERLEELLDNQQTNELTLVEQAELDTYRQINHLFIVLKARTRAASSNSLN